MHPREPFPEQLRRQAGRQQGVLSRAQLISGGLADSQIARMVRQNALSRMDRGLFVVGSIEPTWSQRAWGGLLLGGPQARLIESSAGAEVGLCGATLPIVVGVPVTGGPTARPWVRFVREREGVRSRWSVGSPLRTNIEDTVLDLCSAANDEAAVIGYLTTASQRLTTDRRLRAALARRKRLRHRALVTAVIAEVGLGARSPLEVRWLRDVERPHGLPAPERGFRLASGAVPDGVYEAYRVLLELDGRAFHSGQRRFRDWERDNRNSEDGWLTVRYGWSDNVSNPCATGGNLARVLQRRGWGGAPRICPRCPP